MSAASQKPLRCVALRKDGQPCQAWAAIGDRCVMHSERAAEVQAAGGRATSNSNRALKLLPDHMRWLVEDLEDLYRSLREGQWDERIKTAHAMIACALAISKLLQMGEFEERLRNVERMAQEEAERRDRGDHSGFYTVSAPPTHLLAEKGQDSRTLASEDARVDKARHDEALAARRTQTTAQRAAWQARNGAKG